LNLYTIAPDHSFLEVLARHVLGGFPGGPRPIPPDRLHECRIMLPTRRAARRFQETLFTMTKREALLMPCITAIGDVDEDQADFPYEALELPPAASSNARLFTLMAIIGEWADENPQLRLAADVRSDPHHRHALALSLGQLMDSIEIEDFDAARIPDAYTLEVASHREVILGLIDLAARELPRRLDADGLMGAIERRGRLLRLEAARFRDAKPLGPVIAAGSTGSISATRDLLMAIARLENGAVVLPGLDMTIDGASWNAIDPQHPQYALRQFLVRCKTDRGGVQDLTPAVSDRVWLSGETMRPSATADDWVSALQENRARVAAGTSGVRILACDSQEDEAAAIAFVMRECLEDEAKTAALVTPDRTLARMVKAQLTRWNVVVDDSAGEPLAKTEAASLLLLLCDAALSGLSTSDIARIIHHPMACFGKPDRDAARRAAAFDLAVMRRKPSATNFRDCLALARSRPSALHPHPVLARLTDEDWALSASLAAELETHLQPLAKLGASMVDAHIEALVSACRKIAGESFITRPESRALREALDGIAAEAGRLGLSHFAETTQILRHALQRTPFRQPEQPGQRLSILGPLEARLIRPDTVILGGLNEGVWPSQPDAGPWLNRPMRDALGLQQPERQIGQMAHDFIQALGCPNVYLAYARRIGNTMAQPSRWLLRLEMICKWAEAKIRDTRIPELCARADAPGRAAPVPMPRPKPPVALRPRSLGVTSIERLIKDAYAVYAEKILNLKPLADHEEGEDFALRGSIYHEILGEFAQRFPAALPPDAQEALLAIADERFAAYGSIPQARRFWLPRFRRIAAWFADYDRDVLRDRARSIHAEVSGKRVLDLSGAAFDLTARVDRIDLLKDGTARILDFKSGEPPPAAAVERGEHPQLTLEAAIHAVNGFALPAGGSTSEIAYVRISGGDPPGEYKTPRFKDKSLDALVDEHLEGVKRLLQAFDSAATPYIPRGRATDAEQTLEYDHLSRFREWAQGGGGG
jgi:ATP-dependent helicase/nuclease subunit B